MASLIGKRRTLSTFTKIGKYYLKLREKSLKAGTSKAIAIPYITKLISEFYEVNNFLPDVADFGCADGLILEAIKHQSPIRNFSRTGFDFNQSFIDAAKKADKSSKFYCMDLCEDSFERFKEKFDIGICINSLHEIFSFYGSNGSFNHEKGKIATEKALRNIASTIKPGGYLVFFDGVEHRYNLGQDITIKLHSEEVRKNFLKFVEEYKVFHIQYTDHGNDTVTLSSRDFTRFITKYRFLNSITWDLEKEETYQYFTKEQFENIFIDASLTPESVLRLSPNIGTWSRHVTILTPKADFPDEHILIIAKKI